MDVDGRGALTGITARFVAAFGPLRVLVAGLAVAAGGLLLFSTVGPTTSFFPTIFFACFAIGFGIGNAFMPLLTIAMADIPPADAGLGFGDHERLAADRGCTRAGRAWNRGDEPDQGACSQHTTRLSNR